MAVFAGCGTPVPEVATGEPVSYATHLEALVVAHCLTCHDSQEAKGKLVLNKLRKPTTNGTTINLLKKKPKSTVIRAKKNIDQAFVNDEDGRGRCLQTAASGGS